MDVKSATTLVSYLVFLVLMTATYLCLALPWKIFSKHCKKFKLVLFGVKNVKTWSYHNCTQDFTSSTKISVQNLTPLLHTCSLSDASVCLTPHLLTQWHTLCAQNVITQDCILQSFNLNSVSNVLFLDLHDQSGTPFHPSLGNVKPNVHWNPSSEHFLLLSYPLSHIQAR